MIWNKGFAQGLWAFALSSLAMVGLASLVTTGSTALDVFAVLDCLLLVVGIVIWIRAGLVRNG